MLWNQLYTVKAPIWKYVPVRFLEILQRTRSFSHMNAWVNQTSQVLGHARRSICVFHSKISPIMLALYPDSVWFGQWASWVEGPPGSWGVVWLSTAAGNHLPSGWMTPEKPQNAPVGISVKYYHGYYVENTDSCQLTHLNPHKIVLHFGNRLIVCYAN